MTKDELAIAQFLLGIYEKASDHAFALNPNRTEGRAEYGSNQSIDLHLVALGRQASDIFYELTGKFPSEVHFTELSTLTPAEWTKTARKGQKRAKLAK